MTALSCKSKLYLVERFSKFSFYDRSKSISKFFMRFTYSIVEWLPINHFIVSIVFAESSFLQIIINNIGSLRDSGTKCHGCNETFLENFWAIFSTFKMVIETKLRRWMLQLFIFYFSPSISIKTWKLHFYKLSVSYYLNKLTSFTVHSELKVSKLMIGSLKVLLLITGFRSEKCLSLHRPRFGRILTTPSSTSGETIYKPFFWQLYWVY